MPEITIPQIILAAIEHHRLGRLQDAETIYRQVLAEQPHHPQALHYLGVLAYQTGKPDVAVDLIRRSIDVDPRPADSYYNLGNALMALGRFEEASKAYAEAIKIKPDFAEAFNGFGAALLEQRKINEAIDACRRALALKPDLVEAHINLGNALLKNRCFDDAAASWSRVVALKPDSPEAHAKLSRALCLQGRFQQAVDASSKAIVLRPDYADGFINLGIALRNQRRFDEATHAFRKACEIQPSSGAAHTILAYLLLQIGNFEEGWKEFEWRWKWKDFPSPLRNFSQPRWTGEDLCGRTILLYAEQGLGDTLQFVRYVPLVSARGGAVVLECERGMVGLLRGFPGTKEVIAKGDPFSAFDVQCPLLSLPGIFGTTVQNIPAKVPYVSADASRIEKWRSRLTTCSGHLNVGLVWAGNPQHGNDYIRSMTLENLALLGNVSNVTFFSLQKGEAGNQSKYPPPGMQLVDLGPELGDFADTAAAISLLDLVISVDTSVAHLAGAIGRPVWVLLDFLADWRWLLDREDSPWYPTMRLFRQKSFGDWGDVIEGVARELNSFCSKRTRQ